MTTHRVTRKPFKSQWRWFIIGPQGDLCWPIGVSKRHAIAQFLQHYVDPYEAWKREERLGYTCRRLLVTEGS